ncbi:hypothetical protein [Streptomyces fuscichromogenes]|uniref:Uncharacterized protein n=1 Tax=Streptomyces fuscichromogenes TaxID=1324013 RepID=A0A917UHT3_9ACTN|nr:hypothetical protein [Streptomyces fuscichromogenes]GGM96146.1 hypothetical protein GCM10011578_015850 [Streptomyces fuscichromogenes]
MNASKNVPTANAWTNVERDAKKDPEKDPEKEASLVGPLRAAAAVPPVALIGVGPCQTGEGAPYDEPNEWSVGSWWR